MAPLPRTRGSRLRGMMLIGLTIVLPTVAAAPAYAAPAGGSQAPAASTAVPPEPDAGLRKVNELATASQALGLYIDKTTSKAVVVMPASGPGSAVTSAAFQHAGMPTQVVRSRFSASQVDAAKAAIARRDWHRDAMKYNYGFQFDPRSGVVALATNAPADVVEPLLKANPDIISYQYDPKAGPQSRTNDGQPFAGGAVAKAGRITCSTGFTVRNNLGGQFMMTAGHCFPPITDVSSPGGAYMGLFQWMNYSLHDLGNIGRQTYGGYIYRGNAGGLRVQVYSGNSPSVGFASYCRSGITTFEQCNLTVTSVTASACFTDGYCRNNLVAYTGPVLSQNGDSGAPIFGVSPDTTFNGAFIRGLHIGAAGSTMYAENYATIRDYYGLTVVTTFV